MKVSKPKRRKKLSTIKDRAWVIFSRYIRMRDCLKTTGSLEYGECLTCSNPPQHHISKLDAGHFISGRGNANLFSERGVNAQCRKCNRFHHGNQLEYRRQIIKLYGEGVDEELEKEARQIRKYTVKDLEELIVKYQQKIKELEEK